MKLAFDPALPVLTFAHRHSTLGLAVMALLAIAWIVARRLGVKGPSQLTQATAWALWTLCVIVLFLAPGFH